LQKLLSINGIDAIAPPSPASSLHENKLEDQINKQRWDSFLDSDNMLSRKSQDFDSEVKFPSLNLTTLSVVILLVTGAYLINQWLHKLRIIGKRGQSKTNHLGKKKRRTANVKRWLLQKLPTKLPTV
jgi:hypothetical protein